MSNTFVKILKANNSVIFTVLILHILSKLVLQSHMLSLENIGPLVMDDELLYKIDAEKLFHLQPLTTAHYPPFYPLLLSVTFLSKDHWYNWMFYINAVLSSLVLIPVWLISLRVLPRAASVLVLLITGLSSFHVYYPRLIMSENLYVPIFALSVLLMLNTEEEHKPKSLIINALFGASMALGYLTKYLYLGAIPALVLLWSVKPLFSANADKRGIIESSQILRFLVICAGFILTYLPWAIYVKYSRFALTEGMGASFVHSGIPAYATLKSLVLWINFYTSYGIIALAPFLLVFSLYLFMLLAGTIQNDRRETFFMITVVLLSFIFMATATQHAWRAGYNYPEPMRIMGRYLMHLMPLWVIAFMMALTKLKSALPRLRLSQICFCFLLCLSAMFYSLVTIVLIQDAQGLELGPTNQLDVYLYTTKSFIFFFAAVWITMLTILAASRRTKFLSRNLVLFSALLVILVQVISSYAAWGGNVTRGPRLQLHGRALSQFIRDGNKMNDNKITLISDDEELHHKRLPATIIFWLSTPSNIPSITFVTLDEYHANDGKWPDELFLITKDYVGDPLYKYTVREHSYYVYGIHEWLKKNGPVPAGEAI